ncbi:SRPBCC family protein [bacterium]|nr:SRPBCC family protein [bacterium]
MPQTGHVDVTTPSDREILVTRVFDAPRERVFEALTNTKLLPRWMTGMEVCEIDLRVGGTYRFVWRYQDETGMKEMGMGGRYLEIVPQERIVWTELFDEDWTEGETVVTWTLAESDGKTTLAANILYSSKSARDGALATSMLDGMTYSYDRLDELLEEIAD